MFKVRDIWSALGVALTLILAYLVLERWVGFREIAETVGGETNDIFRTLQGR